jgi:hypothetical protein
MNTNKLKMSWNGSDLSLITEEDIGTFTAHSTTIETNQLCALMMAGFAVLQGVLGGTSTPFLDVKFAPDIAEKQLEQLNRKMSTGQTYGSVSTHWNPTLREWTTFTSTNSDGDGSLVDLAYQPESLFPTLTLTEEEWNSFRSDMIQMLLDEGLLLPQDVPQEFMERSA